VKGNMAFRIDLISVARGELMELLETRVYQSHLQVVRGEKKLPRLKSPCKLQLVFDNTHSMMKEKKLAYKVVVIHHSHIAGRDVEPHSPNGSSSGPSSPAAVAGPLSPAPGPTRPPAPVSAAPAASQRSVEPEPAIDAETIRAFYRKHAPEKKYIEKPAGDAATPQLESAASGFDSNDSNPFHDSRALSAQPQPSESIQTIATLSSGQNPEPQPVALEPAHETAPEFEEAEGEWM
jgi:hypothetical protein